MEKGEGEGIGGGRVEEKKKIVHVLSRWWQ